MTDKQSCHSNTLNTLNKQQNTEYDTLIQQPQHYIQSKLHSS